MKKIKTLVFICIIFSYMNILSAQNCFEPLQDMSGIDMSTHLEELDSAACELISVFPDEYKSQFKTFDFGFYSQNEYMNDDFQTVWDKVLDEISSQYYMIIGKQTDQNGIYSKLWFKLELPTGGNFSCISEEEVNLIKMNVEYALNKEYEAQNYDPEKLYLAEIEAINRLKNFVNDIVSCCVPELRTTCSLCFPKDDLIDDYLFSDDFERIDIEFEIVDPFSMTNKEESQSRNSVDEFVIDYTNFDIEVNEVAISLELRLEENLENFIQSEDEPRIYIISNSNLCDGSLPIINDEIHENLPNMGAIIYLKDNESGSDEMFVKTFGILNEDVANLGTYSIGELEEEASSLGVSSFQELINTVRIAEDSLIANGFGDIEDRIHMIRGVYYGTPWSFDYDQMGSDNRNLGFNAYTYSPMPVDPRDYLGIPLFDKLYNSPEVRDGAKGIDWGHIIIGLDARRKAVSRSLNFPGHNCTGLEACTWVGDLGGGAGKLAWDRVTNPTKRAKTKFTTSHFGGWVNLEGDIASYLIGRNINSVFSAPSMSLADEDYIADALESYLIEVENGDWDSRASLFLEMIAGKEVNDDIINYLATKIEDFGENYLIIRAVDGGNINMIEASSHLKGASREMAEIFIHALQNPGTKIKGTLDPNPTPKGEPYTKYKASKKIQEFGNKIKDWLNN